MDDKFIYYLVIGAIYLVSRMLKKKKPPIPVATIPDDRDDSDEFVKPVEEIPIPSAPNPSSFEELLRELSNEFEVKKEPEPVVQAKEPVMASEDFTPKPRDLTREQKYVQKKKREAIDEGNRNRLIRLAEEEEEEHRPHAVLELLNEEGGAANAVVLSEILNRRY